MCIDVEVIGEACILRLKGRLVTGSSTEYTGARDKLKAAGCRKVIADCREVRDLDAAGIGFLVELYKTLKDSGRSFALANANPGILEVLSISMLDHIILAFDDEQSALAALTDVQSRERVTSAA